MSSIAQLAPPEPAKLIKEKRERLHMTQKELADSVGLSKFGDRTIRRWENGDTVPSVLELKAILSFPEEIPFPNNDTAPYKMIDLFAGIGGTRIGFWETGIMNCSGKPCNLAASLGVIFRGFLFPCEIRISDPSL